eukprot:6376711-Amphidinium_carterae.3
MSLRPKGHTKLRRHIRHRGILCSVTTCSAGCPGCSWVCSSTQFNFLVAALTWELWHGPNWGAAGPGLPESTRRAVVGTYGFSMQDELYGHAECSADALMRHHL